VAVDDRQVSPSGRIRSLHRAADGTLTEGEGREFVEQALAQPDGLLWVDFYIVSEADGKFLSEVFQFHPLTIEDCVSTVVDPAKVDDYGNYLFIVVQALSEYVPGHELKAVEVDFYLAPNYVVSCHRESVPAIERYMQRCIRDEHLLSRGADWLLHGLLDSLVDEFLPIVDAVDDTIDSVEEKVLDHPDTNDLRQIMTVKRNALRLRRATTPQRDIMNRLSRGEFPKLVRGETSIYFRDIYDHLVRIEYLVEALRDLADGALQTYLSVVSNRLNEVMKVLTAAAAIFIPLTLISGIYGMNFEDNQFPSFTAPWGFGATVGAMLVIAVSMLVYFRWRKWI
jgi:magnesium transporter